MMSTGLNTMLYGAPMMSPEHSSMPTMNTAEMFDNMWCSSDSGVSGDQSPSSPGATDDDDQILWDPGDTHVLEANLFNTNINHSFEDDLDLFSFANELGSEEEIEQRSFPDNVSEHSSSSSTITSHSIPSSPEDFSDFEDTNTTTSDNSNLIYPGTLTYETNQTTDDSTFIYPGTLTYGNVNALYGTLNKNQRGVYSKKNKKIYQDGQRKRTSKESSDRGLSNSSNELPSCSYSPEGLKDSQNQTSDVTKGLFTASSSTKKNISNILDSNIKWSDLGSSDQWCLADGLDSVISQSLGVREQLDVKAIIKPHHNNTINNQDVCENNVNLLDDVKLDAVRRYLKSLEDKSHTKSYHRTKKKMPNNPRKKNSKKKFSERVHPDTLLKSTTVNLKEKSKNISPSKIRKIKDSKSQNQSETLKENLSANNSNPDNHKFKKETLTNKNKKQLSDSKLGNKKVNVTKSQPSISWQQRKRHNNPQGTTHTEQPPKSRNSPSKLKEMNTGEKCNTKPVLLTKKSGTSKNNKQVIREDSHILKTRFRKEYRQIMKEKRSGLFLQEELVTLSTATDNPAGSSSQPNLSESDTDDDVDILG